MFSLFMAILFGLPGLAAIALAFVAYSDYRYKSPTDDPDPLFFTYLYGAGGAFLLLGAIFFFLLFRRLVSPAEHGSPGEA